MYRMCREIVRIWWRWHMLRLAPFLEVSDMREHSSLFFGIPLMLTTYIITTKYNLRKRCLLSLVLIRIALIWYWILTSELLFLLVLTCASQNLVSPHSATLSFLFQYLTTSHSSLSQSQHTLPFLNVWLTSLPLCPSFCLLLKCKKFSGLCLSLSFLCLLLSR